MASRPRTVKKTDDVRIPFDLYTAMGDAFAQLRHGVMHEAFEQAAGRSGRAKTIRVAPEDIIRAMEATLPGAMEAFKAAIAASGKPNVRKAS